MSNSIEKALETPLPTLVQLAALRAWRGLEHALRRAASRLPLRPVRTAVREDRRFFCVPDLGPGRPAFLAELNARWPGAVARIVHAAAEAAAHRVDLLGSGPVDLGARINWHQDFKSGAVWPRVRSETILHVDPEGGSDIKVPWELSRLSHLVELGKGYVVLRRETFTQEFLSQVADWEEGNPPGFGVNWACAMEAALRAINLLWAYALFRESPVLTETRRQAFARLLFIHGRFIRANLEFDQRLVQGKLRRTNGNHYIADLAGLVYLGIMLEGREPAAWLAFALAELGRELAVQVLPDGAHWELAPGYHGLVLELLVGCVSLCRANAVPLPAGMTEALAAMLRFTEGTLRPDGTFPNVRDSDDGRVVPLGGAEVRDQRRLVAAASLLCGAVSVPAGVREHGEDALWLLGMEECRRLWALPERPRASDSRAFPHAGYYVLRADRGVQAFAVCAGGGMGGLHAGHAHNDTLSFELSIGGTTFLSDSGTYVYGGSPGWRNLLRSTAYHNTARVDGEEINRVDEKRLFAMAEDARPVVQRWQHTPRLVRLSALHHGYTRLASPVVHSRQLLLDKKTRTLAVTDQFTGTGEHRYELFFVVHPGCSVREVDPATWVLVGPGGCVVMMFDPPRSWAVERREGWVSERYGRKQETRRLVRSHRGIPPCSHHTYLVCSPNAIPDVDAARRAAHAVRDLEAA